MRVKDGSEIVEVLTGFKDDNSVIEAVGQGKQIIFIRNKGNKKHRYLLLYPFPKSNFKIMGSSIESDIHDEYVDFFKMYENPRIENDEVEIKYFAHCEDVIKYDENIDLNVFVKYSIWTKKHLEGYCNHKNTHLWILRVYKLKEPFYLSKNGSHDFFNLEDYYPVIFEDMDTLEAEPVLSDEEFNEIKRNLLKDLSEKPTYDSEDGHEGEVTVFDGSQEDEDVEPIYIEPQQLKKVAEDLTLSFNVFSTISNAINRENHLILQGIPGTGKTELADALCELCVEKGYLNDYIQTTATSDWSTYDTIGGLMPDRKGNLYFSEGIVLKSIKENNLLIIDEINRADIDKAFGPLFTVLSGKPVELNYKYYKNDSDEGQNIKIVPKDINKSYFDEETATYVVGKNWRIIGTMNTYDKDSLYDLSYAFMRRFFMVDVDAPIKTDFEQLIRKFGRNLDPDYLEKVFKLLEINEMKDSRKLGPAIFIDLIEYLLSSQGPYDKITEDNVLEDAVIGFVIPQFEGLPQKSLAALETFLIKDIGLNEKTINKKFLDIQETF